MNQSFLRRRFLKGDLVSYRGKPFFVERQVSDGTVSIRRAQTAHSSIRAHVPSDDLDLISGVSVYLSLRTHIRE